MSKATTADSQTDSELKSSQYCSYTSVQSTTVPDISTSTMSPMINQLAAALSKFRKSIKTIEQQSVVKVATKTGGSYTFKYADLPTIHEAIVPALSENGLAVSQLVGKPGVLTTILMHTSGQYISTVSEMPVGNVADKQAVGGVITYLRRYALAAILGLVSDEDVSESGDSPDESRRSAPQKKKTTQEKPASPPPVKPSDEVKEKPKLTSEIKSKFISAIKDPKTIDAAQKRLEEYDMSLGDRMELKALIQSELAKRVTP